MTYSSSPKFVKVHEQDTNRLIALVAYRFSDDKKRLETAATFLKRSDPYNFNEGSTLAAARLAARGEYYSETTIDQAISQLNEMCGFNLNYVSRIHTFDNFRFPSIRALIILNGVEPFDLSKPQGYKFK